MTYSFSERLEKALTLRNKKPVELSNATGISQALISQYLNNKTSAKNDKITLIADYLNVSESWLAGFTDEIGYYNIEQDKKIDIYGNHAANLEYFKDKPEILEMYKDIYESENLKILFDTARELTPKELEKVLRYMKLVIEEEL